MFFLCHFVPDYFFQSDWIALNKAKRTIPCLIHVLIYTSFFLFFTFSWKALLFIGLSHFLIDRWPIIVKRFIWLKNHINPYFYYPPFKYCDTTGYYDTSPVNTVLSETITNNKDWCEFYQKWWGNPRPFFLTLFLYIVTDNTFHIICNLIALMYLS